MPSQHPDAKFLFVLSPPFSGSTVLWNLLATSPHVSRHEWEGQTIASVAPILRKDPWNPDQQHPWPEIRKHWEEAWDLSKPILLEKSPPNIQWAFELERHFDPAWFVVIIRDPYAFCEGHARRYSVPVAESARFWIRCAEYQKRNIQGLKRVTHMTYESLCERPRAAVKQLVEWLPQLKKLDAKGQFEIHSVVGRGVREISNFNQIKIALLSSREIGEITAALSERRELLDFFGYSFRRPQWFHDVKRWFARRKVASAKKEEG